MDFQRSVSFASIGGVIALIAVAFGVEEPIARAAMSLIAISPLLYIAIKIARLFERATAQHKRKYTRLREITDEFIMHVRNLNRITVAAQMDAAPENVAGMIDEIVDRMHKLVGRMKDAAGRRPEGESAEAEGS